MRQEMRYHQIKSKIIKIKLIAEFSPININGKLIAVKMIETDFLTANCSGVGGSPPAKFKN